MSLPVTLTTPRLELSIPTIADTDAIYEACQDPDIQYFTTVPSPYTREDATGFVSLVAEWWAADSEYVWALRSPDGFAGVVALHKIAHGASELGFWAAPSARGRGYMTEACQAVLDFAFGPMRLERITWRAVVGNSASAAIAQKLGFRFEGTQRKGLPHHGSGGAAGRVDGWMAGLLSSDPRTPQTWPL